MDRAGFEPLALRNLDAVFRLAMHLARDQAEAEDIVQEVFARAFRPTSIAGFDPGPDPENAMRAWLFTITHNVFYIRIKQSSKRPAQAPDGFDATDDGPPPGDPPPLWDKAPLDWDQVDGRLKAAIEELKPEFREVLLMWAVEGFKYREIATILEVPIGTIMSRLHRARKLISERLMTDARAADDLGLPALTRRASREPEAL